MHMPASAQKHTRPQPSSRLAREHALQPQHSAGKGCTLADNVQERPAPLTTTESRGERGVHGSIQGYVQLLKVGQFVEEGCRQLGDGVAVKKPAVQTPEEESTRRRERVNMHSQPPPRKHTRPRTLLAAGNGT